jgi:hypothetical protein
MVEKTLQRVRKGKWQGMKQNSHLMPNLWSSIVLTWGNRWSLDVQECRKIKVIS